MTAYYVPGIRLDTENSLSEYLLRTYYEPGTVISFGYLVMNEAGIVAALVDLAV